MIVQSPQNANAHCTAIARDRPSYPVRQLWQRTLIRGTVLDFGCGLGADVRFLRERGVDVTGYDPHYAPDYPQEQFDTILCTYVLNVLLPEEQAHVLMAVAERLKPTGRAYFTVRRDVARGGFRWHVMHKCNVYQCNVALPYASVLRTKHCEIYEYRHYNQRSDGNDEACMYCAPPAEYKLFTESATAYALVVDQRDGVEQIVVVPKRHAASYFELTDHEKRACWLMIERVHALFRQGRNSFDIHICSDSRGNLPHMHIRLTPCHVHQNSTEGAQAAAV